MTTMQVHPIPALKDNYIWALIDPDTKHVLIVDPGEAKPVLVYLKQQNLCLKGILITHHHGDHTNGILELIQHYPVPVFGPANETIAGLSHPVHDGELVQIDQFPVTFRVLTIPGHTLGHVAFYGERMLFCGDTLFGAGCGRVFEGTFEQMFQTLQKIAALPNDTKIYCGHEYTLNNLRFAATVEPNNVDISARQNHIQRLRNHDQPSLPSTLGEEKATNPFLRCDAPDLISSVEAYAKQQLNDPISVFTWTRKWKDSFI